MRKPLNQIQLYAALLPLRPKMLKFKEKDSASLTADEVKLLQDVYPDVQVLTSGALPMQVNVGCPSCIREIFHIFTSLFDRLEADPNVNKEVVEKSVIDTTDYDVLFEQIRNAWAARKAELGEEFEINSDEATAEMDRLFSEIKAETVEGFTKNRGLNTFEVGDMIDHLSDMYAFKKEPEVAPIAQHVAESFPVVEPEPTQAPSVPLYNEGDPTVEPATSVKKRATKKAAKEVK